MAAIWLFENVADRPGCPVNSVDVETTRIEVRDHEETGTRMYEAVDSSGSSPRCIGRYRTLAEAKAACQRLKEQKSGSPRGDARPTQPHEQLQRLMTSEMASGHSSAVCAASNRAATS